MDSRKAGGVFNKMSRANRYGQIRSVGSRSKGLGRRGKLDLISCVHARSDDREPTGCWAAARVAGGEPSGGSLPEFTKTGAPGSNSTGSSSHGDVHGTSNTPRALSWRCREGRAVRCCRGGPTAVAPCWRRCPSYRGELQATENCQKGKGSRGKAHWGCSWPKMLRGEAGGEVRAGRRGGD